VEAAAGFKPANTRVAAARRKSLGYAAFEFNSDRRSCVRPFNCFMVLWIFPTVIFMLFTFFFRMKILETPYTSPYFIGHYIFPSLYSCIRPSTIPIVPEIIKVNKKEKLRRK
jgi:hypothetical protein